MSNITQEMIACGILAALNDASSFLACKHWFASRHAHCIDSSLEPSQQHDHHLGWCIHYTNGIWYLKSSNMFFYYKMTCIKKLSHSPHLLISHLGFCCQCWYVPQEDSCLALLKIESAVSACTIYYANLIFWIINSIFNGKLSVAPHIMACLGTLKLLRRHTSGGCQVSWPACYCFEFKSNEGLIPPT